VHGGLTNRGADVAQEASGWSGIASAVIAEDLHEMSLAGVPTGAVAATAG
jgi:hypothetical protein